MNKKPKLIKLADDHYILIDDTLIKDVRPYVGKYHYEYGVGINKFPTYLTDLSDCKIITHSTKQMEGVDMISLGNCREIDLGYDLDKLSNECDNPELSWENDLAKESFKKGFEKALEIIGDRKFTYVDMKQAYMEGALLNGDADPDHEFEKRFHRFEKNEWRVALLLDAIPVDRAPNGWEIFPKLDEHGNQILKSVENK